MSRQMNPMVLTNPIAGRQLSVSRNLTEKRTQKLVLMLLVAGLFMIPLWLGLRTVQSAPGVASPPASPSPSPSVTLTVPPQVLIGGQLKFKVTFKNGSAVGFGPFLDLVLNNGGANVAKGGVPTCACDGISFVKAEMVGVTGGPVLLTPSSPTPATSAPCGTAATTITHPFATSGVLPVTVPAGYQLVTLALPFGSFDPTQPEIIVEVTANVSSLADPSFPLKIFARGGFRYGGDPLDNPLSDRPNFSDETPLGAQITNSTAWIAQGQTSPAVMIIKKKYLGPEDETATGPNFIGYYPLRYELTIEIANGQVVNNVVLKDCLPDNMAFHSVISVAPSPFSTTLPVIDAAGLGPNCLVVTWPTLTGGSGPVPTVIFDFFIPERDAHGNPVLPPTCAPVVSNNDISAEADWTQTPADPCDTSPPHIVSDVTPVDHKLTDKCIAIQKKKPTIFSDTGAPGYTPGDTLRYELNFQISDYKTFGNLAIVDSLSDGQTLLLGPLALVPTLKVTDQYGTTSGSFVFNSDLTSTLDPNGSCGGVTCVTRLTFKVSQKMINLAPPIARHAAGILTGGLAAAPASTIPATGQIVFFVKINDQFTCPHPGGDPWVDKDDPINNCVIIGGEVFTNQNPPTPLPTATGTLAKDDSQTAVAIVFDTIKKSVYQIKRGANFVCGPTSINGPCPVPPAAPEVRPGDQVTFRIEKTIPSGDAEKLIVEDWLPQPIFNVTGTTFTNLLCVGVPSPGIACYRSTDTLHLLPVTPTFLAPPTTNSLQWNYPNFNDPANLPRKIDLLFTHTVTFLPFADGLFLTNEARERENNTFNVTFPQVAIAQMTLREPNLRVRKGVVASNNPNAVFNPAPPFPTGVVFNLGGYVSGLINSGNVNLINSNVSNVDANDVITYAVTIENTGGYPAYDVKLEDIIPKDSFGNPTCFTIVPNSITVRRGTGAFVLPIFYSVTPSSIVGGFTITANTIAPPIAAYHPTSGANIVVITFQAKLRADIMPGCCENVAELKHYASTNRGPDFVAAGFTPPFKDPAEVCVKPTLTKSVVVTSEVHTAPQASVTPQNPGNTPQLTIGEIARYHLVVQLPETGNVANFKVTDALPSGMKFLNDGTARIAFVANGPGITHPFFGLPLGPPFNVVGNESTLSTLTLTASQTIPAGRIIVGSSCGDDPVFDLGLIKNNNNDFDLEFIVIEFNALVCNVPGNQNGTTLSNTFSVAVNNSTIATSPAIDVIVVEPNFTLTKIVAPNPAIKGQTLTYAVQYTNNGTADAFNVELKDTLPAGLTFGTITAGCPYTTAGNTLTVTCPQIPVAPNPGSTVLVVYQAVANPKDCPVTLENRAKLTWTSLPGPNGTTVNATGSSTPGTSGAVDGERNGVTPPLTLNDYAATYSAPVKIDCPCNATINGMKFKDLNGNGVRDPGEPGLANWTIKITDANGNTQTVTTDAQGNYSITVPAPGTYTVSEVLQAGWTQTAPTTGTYHVTVSPGQVVNNLDFGNRKKDECDLQITKVVKPNPVVYGQQATFTVTVKNVGTGPCHGPTSVTESLPGSPVSAGGPGWTCAGATCTYASGINAGASVPLTYVYNVTTPPGTILKNCVTLKNASDTNPANDESCIEVKVDKGDNCLVVSNEKISCNPNGTFSYALTVTNVSSSTISYLTFSSGTSNVTITPASMTISLPSGTPTNVTVTIGGTGAVSGANVCFSLGGGAVGAVGCKVQHCITLPPCHGDGTLTVTKIVKNLSPIPFPAGTIFPTTVSCLPSGPTNMPLNLTAGGTQMVHNIQVGSTCTVTEVLPPPISHPACASLGWGTPTYAPGQTVTIPSTGLQAVTVTNYYSCNPTTTCATPPTGMVAWWPLDEPNGATVVNDIVGFNNQGTPKSGGSLGSANTPVAIAGQVGGAANFKSILPTLPAPVPNTTASNIEVPDHDEIDFGTGDLSIDAWVFMPQPPPVDAASQSRPIVSKLQLQAIPFGTIIPKGTGYALYLVASNSGAANLQFSMGDGGPLASYSPNTPAIPFDRWTHVAVTVNRKLGTVVFYINGKSVTSTTVAMPSGSISNDSPLLIGAGSAFSLAGPSPVDFPIRVVSFASFEESLDEIELFNRILTAAEIESIFSAGPVGKCKSTISGLKYNDLNGNGKRDTGEPGLPNWTIKVKDSSGNTQTTTTDSSGNYSFTVPASGTYTVSEVLQSGWKQTAPTTGTYTVTVSSGQAVKDRDFGNQGSDHKKEEEKTDPKVWDVTLAVNVQGRGDVTMRNGCKKPHTFEVTTDGLPFLQLLDRSTVKVPGATAQKLPVLFNTAGMKPGEYGGNVLVNCTDCRQEKGCTQDHQSVPLRLTVVPAAPAARPPGQ